MAALFKQAALTAFTVLFNRIKYNGVQYNDKVVRVSGTTYVVGINKKNALEDYLGKGKCF